jgi:integrase
MAREITAAILSPSGRHGWRVEWRDPDTGKIRRRTIPAELARTKSGRERFRAHVEREANERRIDLDRGATRKSGTAIADAVERYYAQADLANETSYRLATGHLVEWYERAGVGSCDDLDAGTVWRWREHLIAGRKKNGERRAKSTIDTRLRKAGTALLYMHRAKLLPKISRDEIAEACAKTKTRTRERPKPILEPAELRDLFAALELHDADTYGEVRAEHGVKGTPGRPRRFDPLAPFFAFALLTGMRREELLGLTWKDVTLKGDGSIDVHEGIAKAGRPRTLWLDKTPAARRLLATRKLQAGSKGPVWPFSEDEVNQALKRLRKKYGAPDHFDLKALRRTTATYLTNAPGIYDAASIYHSTEQLGHSIETAKKHYLGRVRNISPEARDLETALEINDEVAHVVDMMTIRRPKKKLTA